MKKLIPGLVLALTLALGGSGALLADDFPAPQGYVSDFAGLLSASGRSLLENKLTRLESETGAEVAVVTVPDLGGTTVEDYAVRLFEQWGIGKQEEDNGILFLVALADRQMRIEVGYGLEPIITDGRAGRILDEDVVPSFQTGSYETGIIAGVNSIERYIRDGTPPSIIEDNPLKTLLEDDMPLLAGLWFVSAWLIGIMGRTKSWWLGGVWGVILGIIVGLASGSEATTYILPFVTGAVGLLLDYLISKNYIKNRSGGSTWFSGGSSGGGSRGGSSFGGFSGGSSGGGGASRGW
jgi:uncharacterized protein